MKVNNNFKALFFSSILITLTGALLKIQHLGFSQPLLIVGLLLTLGYMILGIIEVTNSTKIDKSEQILWVVGFILFGFITAIVYLIFGRKNIVEDKHYVTKDLKENKNQ